MSGFEEYLQDYEARELEEVNKFIKRLDEGKVAPNETYPPKERFVKLKEPVANPFVNIWGVVPFYGSSIAKLIPRENKKEFDETHKHLGFTSGKIDEMIDLVKETGRIQFMTTTGPTLYKNLEFLEPLFNELNPPPLVVDTVSLIGHETDRKYSIEFYTLAEHGFNQYIEYDTKNLGYNDPNYVKVRLNDYADRYVVLKALGYGELADEIGTLMIIDPPEAKKYFATLGTLLTNSQKSLFKFINNYDINLISTANELGKPHGIEVNKKVPFEIGKFLLNKMTLYPETLNGCLKLIQEYNDYDLYKVLGSLNEGVKRKNINIIEYQKNDMSEILDNIWKDADKIQMKSEGISYGVSLSLGIIGELAAGIPGTGLMAGLGFHAADKFVGMKTESLSEKIAKFASPDYLVTIYDFNKKHKLTN